MSSQQEALAALAKLSMSSARLDNLITRREREYAAADEAEDQERRGKAKRRSESCGRWLEKYSDSFQAFGEEPPLPIAGEYPGDYLADYCSA
jgi:hypothetical protein